MSNFNKTQYYLNQINLKTSMRHNNFENILTFENILKFENIFKFENIAKFENILKFETLLKHDICLNLRHFEI